MGRWLQSPLLQADTNLICHGGVALQNPRRHLGVAVPGGVLYQHTVRLLGALFGKAHGIIIAQVGNGGIGIFLADVFQSFLCRAFWHIDHRALSQLVCSPRNTSAMVAVGRCHKGQLTQLFLNFLRGHHLKGQLRNVSAQALCDVASNGKRTAQHLEGVEPKAVGLILDINFPYAQLLCKALLSAQRGRLILREAAVKGGRLVGNLLI